MLCFDIEGLCTRKACFATGRHSPEAVHVLQQCASCIILRLNWVGIYRAMGTMWAHIARPIPSVIVETDIYFPPEVSKPHTQCSIRGRNNISKSQPKFGLSPSVYSHGFIKNGIWKHFIILRSCLLKANAKFIANSASLNVCRFTGLQKLQTVLNTKALTLLRNVKSSYARHIT
jgi:hypothetical protein